MGSRVRVFIAASLDGFIAGPNDELDWLDPPTNAEDTFTPFLTEIGALLMGRRTHDIVVGFDVPWPYGDRPVLVATSRALESPQATVRPVTGTIQEMVDEARRAAGDRDVYLDGGALIRSALDAGLVDAMTLTVFPIILGAGVPLFAGAGKQNLQLIRCRALGGGMVELVYRPVIGSA